MQNAEWIKCRMQNAECRVKESLVGAIHESPENERLSYVRTGDDGRPYGE